MATAQRRSSRRKSGFGGLDDEEKKIKGLVERSQRRKSESGAKDLLEHRRMMKELEDDKEEDDEDDDEKEEEEEEEENNNNKNTKESDSDEDDEDDSSDSDSDVDEDERAALDAAMKVVLADSANHPQTSTTKRRRQRQELNAKADPSPYLRRANGVVGVRNNTLIDRRKGSSIDVEALADQSAIYSSTRAQRSNEVGTTTKKSNVVTSGKGWFNLPATEMTEELKLDLRAVRMRGALDPKRFYKALDRPSKFVQIGTIIEGRDEYYSSRLTRKERRTNLVDELMADEKTRQYTKRKFKSIQNDKQNKKRFGPKKKNTKSFGSKAKKN